MRVNRCKQEIGHAPSATDCSVSQHVLIVLYRSRSTIKIARLFGASDRRIVQELKGLSTPAIL